MYLNFKKKKNLPTFRQVPDGNFNFFFICNFVKIIGHNMFFFCVCVLNISGVQKNLLVLRTNVIHFR